MLPGCTDGNFISQFFFPFFLIGLTVPGCNRYIYTTDLGKAEAEFR